MRNVCTSAILFLLFVPALARAGRPPGRTAADRIELWRTTTPDISRFAFVYGGRASRDLLPKWRREHKSADPPPQFTRSETTWRDPATHLIARCVQVDYVHFPATEWTLYLKNEGTADTPLIEKLSGIDARFAAGADATLHYAIGSPCQQNDFEPLTAAITPGKETTIATSGGRSSNAHLPYFNIETAKRGDSGGGGVMVAVGWPGQWSATFSRSDREDVRVRAGQEQTHFVLHPGEEVRSPLIAVVFYDGDWIDGQNLWRRWMIAHNMPRPGGKLPTASYTPCSSHQFGEMIHADEASQKLFIDRYLENGLKIDSWWMDAGWYINNGEWSNTGTWEVDPKRFPRGLRPISDHAHEKGVKIITWFEPERVTPKTWLYEKHPEWLLRRKNHANPSCLLDLGNDDARKWLTDHIDHLLTEQGIDTYRQDYNIDPLDFWQDADSPDRKGISENKYISGYLAYWDELRRRHPNMLIDTCASGGRRQDLETLRRAVPFLRSDYIFEPIGQQCHTYGISLWEPYNGTGWMDVVTWQHSISISPASLPKNAKGEPVSEAYLFRSIMGPHIIGASDVRRTDLNYNEMRRLLRQWREISANYYGDYYPLTEYSRSDDAWMAWQFNRPEKGDGIVQAFRRVKSASGFQVIKLRGLAADKQYTIRNLDAESKSTMSGRQLMTEGVRIEIAEQPGAAVIAYGE